MLTTWRRSLKLPGSQWHPPYRGRTKPAVSVNKVLKHECELSHTVWHRCRSTSQTFMPFYPSLNSVSADCAGGKRTFVLTQVKISVGREKLLYNMYRLQEVTQTTETRLFWVFFFYSLIFQSQPLSSSLSSPTLTSPSPIVPSHSL